MSELKACPFCGDQEGIHPIDDMWLGCRRCGARGPDFTVNPGPWNTRPIEDSLRARIAHLERAVEDAADCLLDLIEFPREDYARRTDDGYPAEFDYDEFAYKRMVDTYRNHARHARSIALRVSDGEEG